MPEIYADGRITLDPDRVARLTLAAPASRNAVSRAMWVALAEIAARIGADDDIRVVILSGAGDTFSAGADITEFEEVYANQTSTDAYNALVRQANQSLRDLPRPVIAEIRGSCVGGGCGLALAADLRFASSSARFGITPARLGLAYSPADTQQLIEKVGPARAKDILFSARHIPAQEALSIGLTDRVYDAADLAGAVETYAEGLASLSAASHRTTKSIVNSLTPPADTTYEDAFRALFSGPDFAEGKAAFLAKRKPSF